MPLNQQLKEISQCNNSLVSSAAHEAWYDSQLGQQLSSLFSLVPPGKQWYSTINYVQTVSCDISSCSLLTNYLIIGYSFV